jgi:hypothetical protein
MKAGGASMPQHHALLPCGPRPSIGSCVRPARCLGVFGIAALVVVGPGCTKTTEKPVPPPPVHMPPKGDAELPTASQTPRRVRRLNNFEMENVLAGVLGTRLDLTKGFLPDPRDEGYDNDAVTLTISGSKVEEVASAAERAAAFITADANLGRFAPCPTVDAAAACARAFADQLARKAWGRNPSDEELTRLMSVFQVAKDSEGYPAGIGLVAQAVLQAPQFVYVTELGGDPVNGQVQLTDFEIASQLSLLLVGSRPDAGLFDAAAAGQLASDEARERQARRLLAAPESRRHLARFLRSWLGLTRPINKDLAIVPSFVPAMRQAVERELDTFLDQVLASSSRLDELMLADYTFPSPILQGIYGDDLLEAPGDFTRVRLAPRRRGLLSSPAFLATHALINQTNPVERGLVVRTRLLCQDISPPPPDVLAQTPNGTMGQTTRQKYEAHLTEPRCRACHTLMDPLGFGFEEFDLLGRYRAKEGEQPIDARGEILNTDVDGPFTGPVQLAARLAGSAEFRRCFVKQLWRFGESRAARSADDQEIDALAIRFDKAEHRIDELLVAFVRKPTFILRKVNP